MARFSVRFGALVPPLTEQLLEYPHDLDTMAHCQADADAITRLAVRGLLPDRQTELARKRLVKKIEEALDPVGS